MPLFIFVLVSRIVSDKRGILFLLMLKFVFLLYFIFVYICVDLLCCFCQYLSGSKQGILCLLMFAFVFYFCLYLC